MIKKGLLDPKKLGFGMLAKNFDVVLRSIAASANEMGVVALKPLQDKLTDIQIERDRIKSELADLQNQAKATTPEAVKAEFRAKTGAKRVTGGATLKEATKQLDDLEKIPPSKRDDATKEKIKNQKILVKLYEKAAEESKRIAKEEKANKRLLEKLTKDEIAAQQELNKAKKDSVTVQDKATIAIEGAQQVFQDSRKEAGKVQDQLSEANQKVIDQAKKEKGVQDKLANSLGNKAAKALSYYVIFNQLKRLFQTSIATVKELDRAMTEAATVTSMNREEAWKLLGTYQQLASETGLAVSELAGVVNQFLRQGRTIGDALELTRVAAQSAKVAGISAKEAVDFLTSAVNGFGLAAQQAESVADKFAAIAARSASSFEELAIAMSKVAPTAQSAGVSIDFMMGVLAKGIETTREAPENIGTAFKTIFARMREVTDLGKAAEDGMSLNRVEKALKSVGVTLRDSTGQFRNLEDVLIDVGNKWSTLTSIEQAYIATALAGTRQQPRLLAIFNDFERTKELIQISADATGELAFQHYEYMQGMEASMTNLKTAWQTFIMALTDSEVVIGIVKTLTYVIEQLARFLKDLAKPAQFTTGILIILAATMAVKTANTIIATIASIKYSLSLLGIGKAAAAATPATAAFGATIWAALGPIALVIGLLVVFAFFLINISNQANKAAQGASYFANKVNEVNSALSDLEKKEDSINKLIKRFEELNRKTAKTVSDLEEIDRIASELGSYTYTFKSGPKKGKEETFNLTDTDFAGNIIINQLERDRMLAEIAADRDRLLAERENAFRESLLTEGIEKTFNNPILLNTARRMGYDVGVAYINGLKNATDEQKEEIRKALEQAMRVVDPSKFTKDATFTVKDTIGNIFGPYNTYAEAVRAAQRLQENNFASGFTYEVVQSGDIFDEEAFKAFSENLSKIIFNFYSNIEKAMSSIDPDAITAKAFAEENLLARVEAYRKALLEVNAITDEEERKVALKAIGATFADEAILFDLLENKKIKREVIVGLLMEGLSGEEIEAYLDSFSIDTSKFRHLPTGLIEQMKKDLKKGVEDALAIALDGDYELGFQTLKDTLKKAGYSDEEIKAEITKLSNLINTLNSQAAGQLMQSQMKTSEQLFRMLEDAAKGNFENFAALAQEFGADAINALMSGDESVVIAQIQESVAETVLEIEDAINKLQALEKINGGLRVGEAAELATLIAMRDYYEQIAVYTQVRNYRLGQAKSLLDTVNKLLEIQNTLLDAGMESSGFLSFLDDTINAFREMSTATLGRQLIADLENLKSFAQEGTGIFDTDNLDSAQFRAALDNYMGTLQEYIRVQQSAFEQYKKTVTQTYKTEIDAVKNAVSEKWKQIEYADRLAEAEERVLAGRRNLAALQLSGAGGSELRQAEKDLKKLEQERRKMIEQQMAEEAQKQLEAERDDLILAKQQEMVDAIKIYTDQFEIAGQQLNNLGLEIPKVSPPIRELKDTTEENTTEVINNTIALQDLNRTLVEMNKPMTGQVARGGGFIDASVFFGI